MQGFLVDWLGRVVKHLATNCWSLSEHNKRQRHNYIKLNRKVCNTNMKQSRFIRSIVLRAFHHHYITMFKQFIFKSISSSLHDDVHHHHYNIHNREMRHSNQLYIQLEITWSHDLCASCRTTCGNHSSKCLRTWTMVTQTQVHNTV